MDDEAAAWPPAGSAGAQAVRESVHLQRAVLAIRRAVTRARLPARIADIRAAVQRKRRLPDGEFERAPGPDRAMRVLASTVACIRAAVNLARARTRVPLAATAIRAALDRAGVGERAAWARFAEAHRSTGLPLAALSACGRGTAEIRYTQLLRHVLDARQPHGLGARCLHALFPDEPWLTMVPVTVEAEVDLGPVAGDDRTNQLDLLIRGPGHAILIEHKIESQESLERGTTQLERYGLAFAQRNAGVAVTRVFLTPDGRAPQRDDGWRAMSHAEVVRRLAEVLHQDLPPVGRSNLLAVLWDLLLGPLACGEGLDRVASAASRLASGEWPFPRFQREFRRLLPPHLHASFVPLLEALP